MYLVFYSSCNALILINFNFADLQEEALDQEENDDDYITTDEPDILKDEDTETDDDYSDDYYDEDNVPDIFNLDPNAVAGSIDAFYNSGSVSIL